MKVYFFKDKLDCYQIFPTPTNLEDFITIEVGGVSELENKVLVKDSENYKLVNIQDSPVHYAKLLNEKKENLIYLIDNRVQYLINQLKEYTYFDQQRLEAQLWTLDNQNPVPLLTSISEKIGMPLPELVKKCLEKTDEQSKRKGVIIGQEVKFKKRLKENLTLEDLNLIEKEINDWK